MPSALPEGEPAPPSGELPAYALKAMGFPLDMFPVLFAIGRMPGWLAHWKEAHENPKNKIGRPRQIYTGPTERKYVALEQRT